MPLSGCRNGVVATVVAALVVLPAQYYVPELFARAPPPPAAPVAPPVPLAPVWPRLDDLPLLDILLASTLGLFIATVYIYDWIQNKVLERRIVKMNRHLEECIDKLRGWDARQVDLETMLLTTRNATNEYNLLLYLLLRRHQFKVTQHNRPFEKGVEDFNFVRNNFEA